MGLSAEAHRERTEERLGNCWVAVGWPAPCPAFLLVLTPQEPNSSRPWFRQGSPRRNAMSGVQGRKELGGGGVL